LRDNLRSYKNADIAMKTITLFLFAWGVIVNLVIFPRLDVDPYHDGFIYPMALLVSQGGVPNKDFFSTYGPMAPFVQGIWLDVFGPSLLNLRIYGAILIVIISILLFYLSRRFLGDIGAGLISTIWLVGNPLIVQPSLPWVDLHTTLILLLGIIYVGKVSSNDALRPLNYFVLGIVLALGVFAKINFSIPLVSVFLLVTIYFGLKNSLALALGVLVTLTVFIGLMYFIGSLKGYIEQGIIFPFSMHDEGKSLRGIFNIKILIFGSGALLIFYLFNRLSLSNRLTRRHILGSSVILTLSAYLIAFYFRDVSVPFVAFAGDLSKDMSNFLKNSPYWLLFSSIFLAVISVARVFVRRKSEKLDSQSVLTGIIGVSSILQLYPNPEPGHIWFVFPVAIIAAIVCAPSLLNEKSLEYLSKLALVPTCVALITINVSYISIDREQHTARPFVGMLSQLGKTSVIDSTMSQLEKIITKETVQYNCPLGIYSVAGNNYRGSDYQYVDLIPKFNKPKAKSDLIFACDLNQNEFESLEQQHRILLVTKGPSPYRINVLYVSP
jgi:hypothetical protein